MLKLFRPFDGTTGVELDESLLAAQESEKQRILAESQMMAQLAQHPGWIFIKQMMNVDIEKYREMLLESRNFEHTRQVQEAIKARQGLLHWISTKVQEGQSFLDEQTKTGENR